MGGELSPNKERQPATKQRETDTALNTVNLNRSFSSQSSSVTSLMLANRITPISQAQFDGFSIPDIV